MPGRCPVTAQVRPSKEYRHKNVVLSAGEPTEQGAETGASASDARNGRVPTWVWVVLSALGAALAGVTLGLFVEARDASANAKAASASSSQLLDDLVADVKTTNEQLKTLNEQFESAAASAQAKASSAQAKQSKRSSPSGQNP